MERLPFAHWLLEQEARALLTRLARVRPFALHEPMVPAAAASTAAQSAIEHYLADGRRELRGRVQRFIAWIRGPGRSRTAEEAQRRFTFLRLRFNVVLSHFDVFADVLTQRSESETGVWLAGLDVVATDALRLPGDYFDAPPVICYLDRGHGAAIRRARTRLPGGGESPVAIVRVPRERMVGSGIASSLVHEVGHQGAALLDLVNVLRPVLRARAEQAGHLADAWRLWERWISEIVADFWSVGRVGVASTAGLMGVVSLPRAFVFRVNVDDPHPMPWMRVRLSCAMGQALYPDPQWDRLARTWERYYPAQGDLAPEPARLIPLLLESMPAFVRLLAAFRPPLMRGDALGEGMRPEERRPERLRALWRAWQGSFLRLRSGAPSLVFAVLGQARADGTLSPEQESRLLGDLLKFWALRDTLETTDYAAARPRARAALAPTG
ncbi:hypothetical protein [Longimicrobium sp.]|uniref:hypothetical protein n=1 Tax=Longimicrobium sp. TaxID=2029185 RepID=UPI002E33457A|nr:hypothetical protein [Longimicrobium sp.]HEX6041285.1 hypothetical protein [Longimicrobium sp.]